MDEATMRMNQQRLELEREQEACIHLMKKIEQEEEWQYQSNQISNYDLEVAREFWYSDAEMGHCLEEIQAKQYAINREIDQVQERRKEYFRKLQMNWEDREDEIKKEYKKRLEEVNEQSNFHQ